MGAQNRYYYMWILSLLITTLNVFLILRASTKPLVRSVNTSSLQDMQLVEFRQELVSFSSKRTSSLPKDVITRAINDIKVEEYLTPNRNRLVVDWLDLKISKKQRRDLALILIPSIAEDIRERKVIRETWGLWVKDYDMKLVFYIGTPKFGDMHPLFTEAELYGDMVVDYFEDGFYRKSLKILRGLDWFVQRYCVSQYKWSEDTPKFLIKADTDLFLHVPNLRDWLDTKDEKQEVIYGAVHDKVIPDRDPNSRFYCPEMIYPSDYYPTFVGGSMYILPVSALPKILEASLHVPLFHLEDVYVTGFLARNYSSLPFENLPPERYAEMPKRVQKIVAKRNKVWNCLGLHVQNDKVMEFLFNVVKRKLDPGKFQGPKK